MISAEIFVHYVKTASGIARLPVDTAVLTGSYGLDRFRSPFERDLVSMMMFSREVRQLWMDTTPIRYVDPQTGNTRRFKPTLRIHYQGNRTVLYEVMAGTDYSADPDAWDAKFDGARRYCAKRTGWTFEVWDQHRIYTPRLHNIQFLWNYASIQCSGAALDVFNQRTDDMVVAMSQHNGPKTLREWLQPFFIGNEMQREEVMHVWWHLVHDGVFRCDLNAPLTWDTAFTMDPEARVAPGERFVTWVSDAYKQIDATTW